MIWSFCFKNPTRPFSKAFKNNVKLWSNIYTKERWDCEWLSLKTTNVCKINTKLWEWWINFSSLLQAIYDGNGFLKISRFEQIYLKQKTYVFDKFRNKINYVKFSLNI